MAAPTVAQLVQAQTQVRTNLAAPVTAAVQQQVHTFTGWYDPVAITTLCAGIVRQVEPVQRVTAQVTAGFYGQYLGLFKPGRVAPAGAVNVTALRGPKITHAGVYGRLADQYRYELSIGTTPDVALGHVVDRAGALVATDLTLAVRAQASASMVAAKISHYRRVIHPEMAAEKTCALCVAASSAVHPVRELMPLHVGCSCLPLPLVGSHDPGHALNQADLTVMFGPADDSRRRDLTGTRYQVDQHGELGPVLNAHGVAWRGPAEVARQTATR